MNKQSVATLFLLCALAVLYAWPKNSSDPADRLAEKLCSYTLGTWSGDACYCPGGGMFDGGRVEDIEGCTTGITQRRFCERTSGTWMPESVPLCSCGDKDVFTATLDVKLRRELRGSMWRRDITLTGCRWPTTEEQQIISINGQWVGAYP